MAQSRADTAALADALSSALNVTVRADGLVADGKGGWSAWGVACAGSPDIPPANLAAIAGVRKWVADRLDGALDVSVPQTRREAMQQQALTAMAAAVDAVAGSATGRPQRRAVRATGAQRRKRHLTAS